MSEIVGFLSGKQVIATKTIRATEDELKSFFANFNQDDLISNIIQLSQALMDNSRPHSLGSQCYNDDFLCHAFELCIKYTSKEPKPKCSIENLIKILQYAGGEADKRIIGADAVEPLKVAMHIAYNQYQDQSSHVNSIARMWFLFKYLWPKYGNPIEINPLEKIKDILECSYRESFIYGLLLAGKGVISLPLPEAEKKEIASLLSDDYTENGIDHFLNYFSTSFENWGHQGTPPSCQVKPIANNCIGENTVYYCPTPNKLLSRISTGIYFDLCDAFKGDKNKNPFKEQFGYVFEKYIGVILEDALKSFEIKPEIVYKDGKEEKKSVDFFVKKDEDLILIEVKQSSIFADSKTSGNLNEIEDDLRKTVTKAFKQIENTKKIIEQKSNDSFSDYYNCKNIIGLVVVNDPLYNANDICRKIISDEGISSEKVYVINITDLEDFLELQSDTQDFIKTLAEKDTHYDKFDFKEYLHKKYNYDNLHQKFLSPYYKEIVPWE